MRLGRKCLLGGWIVALLWGRDEELPVNAVLAIVRALDWLNERIGRAVAWLMLLMALNVIAVFVLRYAFAIEIAWLREAYTWMHGLVFMVGAGYALLKNGYLRIDIVYRSRSVRFRALADLLGCLLFLFPFVAALAWLSWPYVLAAWARLDGAREIGGLPGIFLLKSVILVFCLVLGLQGLAMAGRAVLTLGGRPPAAPEQG